MTSLLLLAMGSHPSAQAIDLTQFAPDPRIRPFSVYATDSIYLPNQSGTATGGSFGSGGGIFLNREIRLRSPYVSAHRDFFLGNVNQNATTFGGAEETPARVNVDGIFRVEGKTTIQGATQIQGEFQGAGNDIVFKDTVIAGTVTLNSDRQDFYGLVHIGNTFSSTGGARFFPGSDLALAGTAASFTGQALPTGARTGVPLPNPLPLGNPLVMAPAELPGHTIAGYSVPATLTSILATTGTPTVPTDIRRDASGLGIASVKSISCGILAGGGANCKGDTLQPGYYGDLVLDNNDVSLILTEGFYSFRSIRFGSSSNIIAVQPNGGRTFVYSEGDITATGSGTFIGPADAFGATGFGTGPGEFLGGTFMLLGGADMHLPNDQRRANGGGIWATVSAPHGTVYLGSQIDVFGQVFAQRVIGTAEIDFGQGAYIPFDPKLPTITIEEGSDIVVREAGPSGPDANGRMYKDTVLAVRISKSNAYNVSVDWRLEDIEAVWNKDYGTPGTPVGPKSGSILIPKGSTQATLTLRIFNDDVYSGTRHLRIVLDNPTNAQFSTGLPADTIGGTILDDELPPTIYFAKSADTVSESVGTGNFEIRLTSLVGVVVPVTLTITGGTANNPADYAPRSLVVTLPAGALSANLQLDVVDDNLDEVDLESALFRIASVGAAVSIDDARRTLAVQIRDNDPPPSVGFSRDRDSTGEASGPAVVRVELSGPTWQAVQVRWATSTGTASAADFSMASGTLTIPAGATSANLSVALVDDALDEDTETFAITLSAPVNAVLGARDVHTHGILDDDAPPSVAFAVAAQSGSEAIGTDSVRVQLSTASGREVRVSYGLGTGSSATVGADFIAPSGTLVFPAGTTSRKFPLAILQDLLDENAETVRLILTGAVNATLGLAGETYTILDDDAPPVVSFAQPTGSGPESVGTDSIEVRLSAVSGLDVRVGFGLGTGFTASAGVDFVAPSGTLTIPAGSDRRRFPLSILQDRLDEDDETIALRLSSPVNATLGGSDHLYTIFDDDAEPLVKFAVERASGLESIGTDSLLVVLSDPSSRVVTVRFGLGSGSSASSGIDFVEPLGVLTLPAGETQRKIPLTIIDDLLDEDDETVVVQLFSPTFAVLDAPIATYTILDDDAAPSVGFERGTANTLESVQNDSIDVVLSAPSGKVIRLDFGTRSGGTATAGTDYLGISGTLTFPAGTTRGRFAVVPKNDLLDETDETVLLSLTSPVNASAGLMDAVWTILDDDAPPVATMDTLIVDEPAQDSLKTSLRVRLSAPSGLPIDLVWYTADATALSDLDYRAVSPSTIRIPAGATSAMLPLVVLGDDLDEFAENFKVVMTSATNATIGRDTSNVWITDTDAPPTLSIDSVQVVEPGSGQAPAVFRIRLSGPSAKPVSVKWSTTDGTATAGADYLSGSDSVLFQPGQTERTATVQVLHDDLAGEPDETFFNTLSASVNATLGTSKGLGVIREGNGEPELSILGDTSVVEDDRFVSFRLTLSNKFARPVTVQWQTLSGTATAGLDFADSSGTVVFPAQATEATFQVRILEDLLRETVPETFQVRIVGDTNVVVVRALATDTILDDNDSPDLRVANSPDVVEGGKAVFRVTLGNRSDDTIRVVWRTRDSTASSPADFQGSTSDTLVFLPGQTAQDIIVATWIDSLWEPTEQFSVELLQALGAELVQATARANLLEEGPAPTLTWLVPDSSVIESIGQVSLEAELSRPASLELTFEVTARGITAVVPADASLATGRIRFPAGTRKSSTDLLVVDDALDEVDETLELALLPAGPVTVVSGDPMVVTILDDDPEPWVVIDGDTLRREESAGRVEFQVRLSAPSGKDIQVWIAHEGTATPQADYDLPQGFRIRVAIAAGDTVAKFSLGILDDRWAEFDETVVLRVDSTVNGRSRDTTVLVIVDDDGIPKVSFAKPDSTVPENVGIVRLPLVLDRPSVRPVTIGIRSSGSVTITGDRPDVLVDTLFQVTFAPGDTLVWVEFQVVGDGAVEPDEILDLVPVAVSGGYGQPGAATKVTIRDDDRNPRVEIVRPVDSLRTRFPDQKIEWTWDEVSQAPVDTTLQEGWNTIRRCATDTAGNVGCDQVDVWGDFTPPRIKVWDPDEPKLVNHSDNSIHWWVEDGARLDSLRLDTTLAEGRHIIVRTACDEVGNCASDTGILIVDLTPPKVTILTPPEGSVVPGGQVLLVWQVVDGPDTTLHRELIETPVGGKNTFRRCATDAAGNEGCDETWVDVRTPAPTDAWFLDTDGDGRIDAAVVQYPVILRGTNLPEFEFSLDGEVRGGLTSSGPVAGASRGTLLKDSDGKTVLDAKGNPIWVAPGLEVRDSAGKVVRDPQGHPVVVPVGDTLRGSDGNILRDSLGRELFRVPADGELDSTRLLVKIKPPFEFGKTSVDSDSSGSMTMVQKVWGPDGDTLLQTIHQTFPVLDSVAPVILQATVERTEDYDGFDALILEVSEPLVVPKDRDWLEIEVGGIWVTVPAERITFREDGSILVLVEPGPDETGSPSPGLAIRFRPGVSDSLGNSIPSRDLHWATEIVGPPRGPRLVVQLPNAVGVVPSTESSRVRPEGFVITATSGGNRDDFEPWRPGQGYLGQQGDAEFRSLCPEVSYCNGVELEVNLPMRVQVFVYDLLGTHAGGFEFRLTADDLANLKPDQLDRYRIRVLWNQRGQDGRVVSSGIYPWRIVSWVDNPDGGPPRLTNQVVNIGVKSRLE